MFAGKGEVPRRVSPRREELLEIAAELFAQQGFAGVTVHNLGAAAGVSGPALYHHFDSKEAMLGEMLVGTSHHLLAAARALHDSLPPDQLLAGLIAIHVDFSVDHRALISVEYRDLNKASPDDQDRVRLLQGQYVEIWVDALVDRHPGLTPAGAAPGRVRRARPDQLDPVQPVYRPGRDGAPPARHGRRRRRCSHALNARGDRPWQRDSKFSD